MEPITAPMRLISRKFVKRIPAKLPKSNSKLVSKKWLLPTVGYNGSVRSEYKPMLNALYNLNLKEYEIKSFREALRTHNLSAAESCWRDLGEKSEISKEVPYLKSWADLASSCPSGAKSYGPPGFTNALNDIARHNKSNPQLVKTLLAPSESPLDPYMLGFVLSKLGVWNLELAISLLAAEDWTSNAKAIGFTSILDAVGVDPIVLTKLIKEVGVPENYKLPPYLVSQMINTAPYNDSETPRTLVDTFKLLVDNDMLLSSKPIDKLLRRIYSESDYGALTVRECAGKIKYPWSFYPFLVRRLCERVALGDELAQSQLDHLFDHELADLAPVKPSLVLHLLVMRIIVTDGVQATSSVLNRWVESDPDGVSEPTWMLLFQAFRRMGRPDKCSEVLGRALQSHPQISLPFIGEYLMYISQFHNLHVYTSRLLHVLPEMKPVLHTLGIMEYVASLPTPPDDFLLQPFKSELTPQNREFTVHRIHESWLTISYQAVLATVETPELAVSLFEKYVRYVSDISHATTSLRVVDQFVALVCSLPDGSLDVAENIYRTGLEKLKIKKPTDGKNHSKSLEVLCYKLIQEQRIDRAVQLLVDAHTNYGISIRKTTLDPWLVKLPENIRNKLAQWAHDHAGVVI